MSQCHHFAESYDEAVKFLHLFDWHRQFLVKLRALVSLNRPLVFTPKRRSFPRFLVAIATCRVIWDVLNPRLNQGIQPLSHGL